MIEEKTINTTKPFPFRAQYTIKLLILVFLFISIFKLTIINFQLADHDLRLFIMEVKPSDVVDHLPLLINDDLNRHLET
jgi:hypothetical protein